jgi:hypothetical protein
MQSRRPIAEVVSELRSWQQERGIAYEEIAFGAGVDLSSVYRLFGDGEPRKRYGKAVKQICKFANIRLNSAQAASEVPAVVRDAVLRTWDGSDEHANRLATAITAVGDLIRQAVSSK